MFIKYLISIIPGLKIVIGIFAFITGLMGWAKWFTSDDILPKECILLWVACIILLLAIVFIPSRDFLEALI